MIRFIDLTNQYFIDVDDPPRICAFISTTSDKFIVNDSGTHIFHDKDDVRHIANIIIRERCLRLIPPDYWTE